MGEENTSDSYINIWKRYDELEHKFITDKAIDLGALRYSSFEVEGTSCRFDITDGNQKRLELFEREFKRGDILSLTTINPFEQHVDSEVFNNFLEKNKKFILNAELVEINLNRRSVSLNLNYNTEKAQNLNKDGISSGYIFMSVHGDEKRFKRRNTARSNIETLNCPMPNLAAILEGKSVSTPRKTRIPALSETVEKEIFTDKNGNFRPPTGNQTDAIEMALNTPDIALIQGPPGTGKTTVITAILKRLNEEADYNDGMFGRNLVSAFQHDALQNVLDRIEILGLPAIKFGKRHTDKEDDNIDIDNTVQNWINDKLANLNEKYAYISGMKYLEDYNKLYIDFLCSSKTVRNSLNILKSVEDMLDDKLSTELSERLYSCIYKLQLLSGTPSPVSSLINHAVRRIPTNEAAFSDNGIGTVKSAIFILKYQNNHKFDNAVKSLEEMDKTRKYDFDLLKKIRRELLVKIMPRSSLFTKNAQTDEIIKLLTDISEHLMSQLAASKDGEDLAILQYMQNLRENPIGVKKAILDYTTVNGATNQQVMGHELSTAKGGNIVYDNVLIDEAARSNPLDLFIPLSVARDRIILVGDHRQLPHMVDNEILNELEKENAGDMKTVVEQKIKESMFEHLFNKLKLLEKTDNIKRTITLNKQFRMHPVLGKFVNDNFYEKYSQSEKVENGIENPEVFLSLSRE
ncbi:MAG: AAA family ATPase [Clostridiales bacterium]|nr:AAA family ATPase [Clostridiales bacterium]